MAIVSVKLTSNQVDKFLILWRPYLVHNNHNYAKYTFKIDGTLIIIYNTNTCTINTHDINSFLNTFLKREDLTLFNVIKQQVNTKKNNQNVMSQSEIYESTQVIIGSDEVGVGDLFGGIVVCAVSLKKSDFKKINHLKIIDSKKLNDQQMQEIYQQIKNQISYTIVSYNPKEYNELIKEYNNAHILKTILHYKALQSEIHKHAKYSIFSVVDAFSSLKNWNQYLQKVNFQPYEPNLLIPKAESIYTSVALASIIARVMFLKMIAIIEEQFNVKIPLGSSNPLVNDVASNIFQKFGLKILKQVAKEHFSNFQQIIKNK
ncbi:ribonuclease HIII [Ureaplasma parvum]|uniref:ribonuclease HIII n=1 Tax=Ureaplasma parvum TaxID=134821 RepID=UPI00309490FB